MIWLFSPPASLTLPSPLPVVLPPQNNLISRSLHLTTRKKPIINTETFPSAASSSPLVSSTITGQWINPTIAAADLLSIATGLYHNRPTIARHNGAHISQIGWPSSSSRSSSTTTPTTPDLSAAHPSTPSSASLPNLAGPTNNNDTPPRHNTTTSLFTADLLPEEEGERSRSKKERIDCVVALLLLCRSQPRCRCRRGEEKKPISSGCFMVALGKTRRHCSRAQKPSLTLFPPAKGLPYNFRLF